MLGLLLFSVLSDPVSVSVEMKVRPSGKEAKGLGLLCFPRARPLRTAFLVGLTPLCLPRPVCVRGKPCDSCSGHVPQGLPEGLSAGAAHPGPVGCLLFSGPRDVNRGE